MSETLTALTAAVPLAAGWTAHAVALRRGLSRARRDPLTGLWTRDAFTRKARRLLRDERAVVVLADVDRFKQVNDRYGHAAGDALLASVARRLAHAAGRAGVCGRLGGDEFAAVLIDADGTAADLLALLHGVLARPAEGQPAEVATTVSLGWVRAADHPGGDLSALLARADEALYQAKQADRPVKAPFGSRLRGLVTARRSGRRDAVREVA
ncbi:MULTISPECIES: GGDEF domain-containing protein [Streptomyces]|uniref:GGDEF domain-containing protein n=1 Tax=Streptomyces evansiae TaxID=3075535 RepID=A0ABU2R3X2_9ACTN|nr:MULTISPECIES: GGDEF domain-containing protein [unclassified Streptomyces]MDT0411402.1 GGDEF domain-containing protein [Streptomyces sp. DSM 41979]MYQ56059.1 diguanylate cyclase [Streptomyces sp. SID4926]SCE53030.1 diguanylate cyclase (GGDEF) domain-containing protein [Streptomyces sp. DfronAA-171]